MRCDGATGSSGDAVDSVTGIRQGAAPSVVLALLPTSLLAVSSLWSGTFHGAASAAGAVATQAAVLGFCLLAAADWQDPLRLGRGGRWLAAALLATVIASWWLSPVSRAGRVGVTLLPAYLLIPAATAFCWSRLATRRLGLRSLALLTLAVSVLALVSWQTLQLARAALPLGHHNLLAGWLVLVLPLTLVAGRETGGRGWLPLAAGVAGLAALAATGSLLAYLALAVQALAAALWWKRLRRWLVPLAAIAVLLTAPRLSSIASGLDSSARARVSYLAAGWRGFLAKPLQGWGPGAVPWTAAEFVRPGQGPHPASEIVGDLHSFPVQLAYELGSIGLLLTLALIAVFAWRRWTESDLPAAVASRRAALLGLLGGLIFALGSAPVSVPALPITLAIVAGVALVPTTSSRRSRRALLLLASYCFLGALILVPLARAHLHYDRARQAPTQSAMLAELERAHELDPLLPLYRARSAWLQAESGSPDGTSAGEALRAAAMARGLAPLWLAAGDLGRRDRASWAVEALETAHRLDPLSPLTAFHLMMAHADQPVAVDLGSKAVQADPRLASASFWREHGDLADSVAARTGHEVPGPGLTPSVEPLVLALTLDRDPAVSFSLFAFRRSPLPGRLAPVELVSFPSPPEPEVE